VETRVDQIENEDIDILSNLNMIVELGVESLSPGMLKIMRKTHDPERYIDSFKKISGYCNEKGVMHRINLLFNHPGETKTTIEETLACLSQHLDGRKNTFCFFALYVFMLFINMSP